MKLYSAHFHPPGSARAERPPILVKQGISFPCLFLGWIGLLLTGSWMPALLAGGVSIALASLLRPLAGAWPILAGLQVLLAFFANDLRRWDLRLRGFASGPLVAGGNAEAALVRLLDCRPDLLGAGL